MNDAKTSFWDSWEHGFIVGLCIGIIATSIFATLLARWMLLR